MCFKARAPSGCGLDRSAVEGYVAVIDNPPQTPERRRIPAELLAFGALILWRLVSIDPRGLWRDWLLHLAVFGLAAALLPEKRSRTFLAGVWMATLMLLYSWGQLRWFHWPSDYSP
ncbi:MAG: hypothetical protein JO332_08980 [Planctomycetaceae bacterium]|nr:hypothetical protein [Planctomycetaceae bacterium]